MLKNSLKNTFLYNIYLFFFNKEHYLNIKKLVFDIGANIGNKTKLFNKLGTNVISVNPDKFNYKILRTKFKNEKNITVLNCAISDVNGKQFSLSMNLAQHLIHFHLHGKILQKMQNLIDGKWLENLILNMKYNL